MKWIRLEGTICRLKYRYNFNKSVSNLEYIRAIIWALLQIACEYLVSNLHKWFICHCLIRVHTEVHTSNGTFCRKRCFVLAVWKVIVTHIHKEEERVHVIHHYIACFESGGMGGKRGVSIDFFVLEMERYDRGGGIQTHLSSCSRGFLWTLFAIITNSPLLYCWLLSRASLWQ